MQHDTPCPPPATEDEIDLRDLFATLWRHKAFIFWFTFILTLITVILVYRMPKYYKTTTVIEVKPKSDDKGGFNLGNALGGAGALLGLAGIGGDSSSTAKDAAMMSMFRTNRQVLERVDFKAQYYVTERFRDLELTEDNCSLSVSGLKIYDYRKFGMKVRFHPVDETHFSLVLSSKLPFLDELLGTFTYDTPIKTDYFECAVHRKNTGVFPKYMIFNGDMHYIYNTIISKNLSVETGGQEKKTAADLPFVTIRYFDTLPERGETYVQTLVQTYIRQSIGDELEDINTSLQAINRQIEEIRTLSTRSARIYEKYKSKNAILSPEDQAKVLIEQKALAEGKLSEIRHKLSMVNRLITQSKNKKNIDTMAPALVQIGDEVTAGFIGKLQDLQIEEEQLAQEFTPAYPKLKTIRKQIRNLRAKIAKSLRSLRGILRNEDALLTKEIQAYTQKLRQGPKLETNLAPLMRDYKLYETIYTYLLQKRSSLELKKAEALSRFRTIDPVYTDPRPAKPNKALIAVVGMLTAFILAVFIVFFRAFLRTEEQNR